MIKIKSYIYKYWIEIAILVASLIFSTWLMSSTFSYNNGFMQISTKAWSDFASHIPLIRSFSFGLNFPTQYPLFLGSPIKYHFLFYALVGLLEKSSIRIDYALNALSILGFTFLMFMIFQFAKYLFKSKAVGILSIIFFLFNSSLDFYKFFNLHHPSFNSILDIFSNSNFPSFGPYDNSIISAFWNLNIYTNQRHLAISYGFSLLLIFLILKLNEKNKSFKTYAILGIIFGLLFLLNFAVYLMTFLILLSLFILIDNNKGKLLLLLFTSSLIALPQYLYIESGATIFKTTLHLGYLIDDLNILNFINYWWQNLGISIFTIILGLIYSNKFQRKIFYSFFSLFLIGNLFQFSPEIAANHKFFNFFIILGNMYSAFIIIKLFKKSLSFKILSLIVFLFLIISGIIDFFPIFNDTKINLADFPQNKNILWIKNNTPPNSNFLNTNYLYDDASIAGRKIFLGWPYFAWSQGYDTQTRDDLRKNLLNSNDLAYFCKEISKYHINYAEIDTSTHDAITNYNFFYKNFPRVYFNEGQYFSIFNLGTCNNLLK